MFEEYKTNVCNYDIGWGAYNLCSSRSVSPAKMLFMCAAYGIPAAVVAALLSSCLASMAIAGQGTPVGTACLEGLTLGGGTGVVTYGAAVGCGLFQLIPSSCKALPEQPVSLTMDTDEQQPLVQTATLTTTDEETTALQEGESVSQGLWRNFTRMCG